MKTFGIDLGAQDDTTSSVRIDWDTGAADLVDFEVASKALRSRSIWVGIDAPFGYPNEFKLTIQRYFEDGFWPVVEPISGTRSYEKLRLRQTDVFVRVTTAALSTETVNPLSVSADKIAVCAWRCIALLNEAREGSEDLDRIGNSTKDIEVYPAAALAMWGIDRAGYKKRGNAGRAARSALMERILRELKWLRPSDDFVSACALSDHNLDAFIAAVVARARERNESIPPEAELAESEGWIHLPKPQSLSTLARDTPGVNHPGFDLLRSQD